MSTHLASRHHLSQRGERLLTQSTFPAYLQEHFVRSKSPYDPATNSHGYIGLSVAENRLVWDLLRDQMCRARDVPHSAICYGDMIGSPELRAQLAQFMGSAFLGRRVSPDNLAVLAGTGSVLEVLFHSIADPGDGVLIPTPSYAGLWPDLERRDELEIVPIHTSIDSEFLLTTAQLNEAMRAAKCPIKALLFTSPSNPLGTVYSRDHILEIVDWAESTGVHLVFDEIYALSTFGNTPFTSVASVVPTLGDKIHVAWAFSKDFGASGLRCGVLLSENPGVLAATAGLAYWASCSGHTQFLLEQMLADRPWVDSYLAGMRAVLARAYQETATALDEASISFTPAEAGFFVLLDLRHYLDERSWAAEHALWRRILERENVGLTPGAACHNGEPGFMRLCFAAAPPETVVTGIRRIARAVRRGD